jgi:hypothetical protein
MLHAEPGTSHRNAATNIRISGGVFAMYRQKLAEMEARRDDLAKVREPGDSVTLEEANLWNSIGLLRLLLDRS